MASFRNYPGANAISLIAVVLGLCTTAGAVEFNGGTGEPNNPYQIATAEQLIAIGSDPNLLNKHFVLVADIDLDPNLPGGRVFDQPVIGADATGFSGSFDGRGRTIANLHIIGQRLMSVRSISISADTSGDTRRLIKSYAGLFKTISPEGSVSNLNLRDVEVVGGDGVAALAVENQGAILNCCVRGIVSGASTVAGLMAVNRGSLAYCHADVVVTGSYRLGGLIGCHEKGSVTHSSARGSITGTQNVGGLIGEAWDRVTHCWAAVDITTPTIPNSGATSPDSRLQALSDNLVSGRYLGGLIGYCWKPSSGREPPFGCGLRDCYAAGSITAGPSSSYIGGLAGELAGSTICCYAATRIVVGEGSRWIGGLAGYMYSRGLQGCFFLDPNDGGGPDNKIGTPLTSAQMCQRDSYMGWDFFGDAADGEDDPWFMPEDSYPVLTSQTEITGLVHLPSLGGIELNQALALIESAALTVGEITEDYNREMARGRVLDITPHGALPKGSVVQVVVSTGPYRWEENPGDGSPSNPYQIQTRIHFLEIGQHPELYGKCFMLTCDLDLGDLVFQQAPIAPNAKGQIEEFSGTPFSGRFDGGMHTISNLTITSPNPTYTVSYVGLFGCVAAGGKVSRLRLENARINHSGGLQNSALLCGESQGEIRDCHAKGEISYANYTTCVGGLVGTNRGFVTRSTAEATLFFADPAATTGQNLVATTLEPIPVRDGATALSANAPHELGVLVGTNDGVITNCRAKGSVTGSQYSAAMGGITGANGGVVASCYSVAIVCGERTSTGGAAGGYAANGCYYLRDPTLPDPADGYGIGLTDSQMRQQASFVGFDFAGGVEDGTGDAWVMPQDGGYPVLADERPFDLAGQGTEAEPYLVGSVQDLGLISQHPDAHYRLISDIDCSGIIWPGTVVPWFSGTFDGAGHKISHAVLSTTGSGGLLGFVLKQAEVHDLSMEDVEIVGTGSPWYVGALACINHGRILNCSAAGRITGTSHVGGLVGKNGGAVYACRTDVALTGIGKSYCLGGLIGNNISGIVVGCHAAGPVVGPKDSDCVGGLIGRHHPNRSTWYDVAWVAYCCSSGSVTGASYTGGLLGQTLVEWHIASPPVPWWQGRATWEDS